MITRIIKENGRIDFNKPGYQARYDMEMDAICRNSRVNLADYFLVLEDLIRYCRQNNVPVGPGRGSGAGSLVLYGLGVTMLDPIEHSLLFERFISKGRIEKGSLPDVDLDFADQDIVREYLIEMYGEDRVRPIGTYQTIHTKGAIQDAFRHLYPDVHFLEVENIKKLMNDKLGDEKDEDYFEIQMTQNPAFADAMRPYPLVHDVIKKMVGLIRQQGIHPCGLAITQDPLDEFLPIRWSGKRSAIEFSADDCEDSGIIKYDVLGLITLKYFQSCFEYLKQEAERLDSPGFEPPLSLEEIPLDDRATLDAFERGDTESVFQFNSDVAKSILTKLKLDNLQDLSMTTSVGRPGTMENKQHLAFIRRKNGQEKATAPHPALEQVLSDTYGIMIYQESVMMATQILADFTLAEADDVRKAMGKKKLEVLLPYKEKFIQACQRKWPDTTKVLDVTEGDQIIQITWAEHLWRLMETFSGYGFNRSHSMSYALIGYHCQYLKTHYPQEWWAACCKNAKDAEVLRKYYQAGRRYIWTPSFKFSTDDYYINHDFDGETDEYDNDVYGVVIMPPHAVKGVGQGASTEIYKVADAESFEDFFNRVKKQRVHKNVMKALIFSGFFSNFNSDPLELIKQYYGLRKEPVPDEFQNLEAWQLTQLKHEYLNFMPQDFREMYPRLFSACIDYRQISNYQAKAEVHIVGRVKKRIERKTKKNKKYANVLVEND